MTDGTRYDVIIIGTGAGGGTLAYRLAPSGKRILLLERVLGFEPVSDVEVAGPAYEHLQGVLGLRMRVVRLRRGDESLELTEYPVPKGRPVPPGSRSHDRWFQHVALIVSDMDRAYARLRRHRVEHASSGPQTLPDWNPVACGIRAFYFRDPDGHPLEILRLPPGRGDPKWHRPSDRLFLGIDHTANVVEDTEASLRFCRDTLGLTVAGSSENYGPEQDSDLGNRGPRTAGRRRDAPSRRDGIATLVTEAPGLLDDAGTPPLPPVAGEGSGVGVDPMTDDGPGFLDWGREVCGVLPVAESREWLCTNGIGGFASGTVAGLLTRRYHGLLVAALAPPLGRTLLVAKADETVEYDGATYRLAANRWADGTVDPHGYRDVERFRLEGTTPVWTFACGDARLEKRVFMEPGANTTYVRYRVLRGRGVTLELRLLANYRDCHGSTRGPGWQMRVEPVADGLRITAYEGAGPFLLLARGAGFRPAHTWYEHFWLAVEQERGLAAREDHLHCGTARARLGPGDGLTLVCSAEPDPDLDGEAAWQRRRRHEDDLRARWRRVDAAARRAPAWIEQLVLAADQFVVRRPSPEAPDGMSVIAGYPWFGDWGRDTMICLPGLTLATGRPEVARPILTTFARFVDRGMLPNRFPDRGEVPEYNTVDATLWYVEAIRAYHAATEDDALLEELYPVLEEIVARHRAGTRYGIAEDPADGLLRAGEPGVQLTWMDARVGDWVVTPRIGKPVEVNALWYNGLRAMAGFARRLGRRATPWDALAERVRDGFGRFWHEPAGHCYDVIDGPDGADPALRPNQIVAVSLPESPLALERQRMVVDACARHLLASFGLRSLAPGDPRYRGRYGGGVMERDGAYHQGPVWGWLLGPFALAHLRVYGDAEAAAGFIVPMAHHLADYGVGSLAEIFDGDPPHTPRGCIAQAWSVAETLRAWLETARRARRD